MFTAQFLSVVMIFCIYGSASLCNIVIKSFIDTSIKGKKAKVKLLLAIVVVTILRICELNEYEKRER
jgi:hypothetical protein